MPADREVDLDEITDQAEAVTYRVVDAPDAAPTGAQSTRAQPSEKQIAANRANATRSTGPRTETGKAESARNATKHGVYADGVIPISRGVYAEDVDMLERFTRDIAESLQPRDAVERAQAMTVAGLYNQLRRLDRYEADCLARDGKPSEWQLGEISEDQADQAATVAKVLWEVFIEEVDLAEREAEYLTKMLLALAGKPRPNVRGLWTDERVPENNAEWCRVFRAIARGFWGDDEHAAEWAWARHVEYCQVRDRAVGAFWEHAAKRILEGTLDRSTRLRARLGTELSRALERYTKLRDRELDTSTDEESSEDSRAG